MANLIDTFSGDLTNWTNVGPRTWFISSDLLKVQDMVASQVGFIVHNTTTDVNGILTVEHDGLDLYQGDDNAIVFKYQSLSEYMYIRMNPGQYDSRGIRFGRDDTDPLTPPEVDVTLYNSLGQDITTEVWPNKTALPTTGKVVITITNGDTFDIVWYDSGNNFVVSGQHIDDTYDTVDGQVGFFHEEKWDANINGWDFIQWEGVSAAEPPTIVSFSADNTTISEGNPVELGWVVTSGTDTTTVWISEGIGVVDLTGTSADTPLVDTTYYISACNTNGCVSADLDVFVTSSVPIIFSFSASDTPISAGGDSELGWTTSGATSAFIDCGIGWIDVGDISAGTYGVSGLSATKTFTMSAFDDTPNLVTAQTTVVVIEDPLIISFSADPIEACSGVDFDLEWVTSGGATSAFIDNGVGYIDTSAVSAGSETISADLPTIYTLSAWNDVGVLVTETNFVQIFYRDPIADAGPDQSLTATDVSGVTTNFNASGSIDPDGQAITYQWLSGGTEISTLSAFDYPLSAGASTITLNVFDPCGQSGTDTVLITVDSLIPPVASATATPNPINASATTLLDGSDSYDPDNGALVSYFWFLDSTLVSASVSAEQTILSAGEYTYTLVVYDTSGLSASDDITVFVDGVFQPSANAGPDENLCYQDTSGVTVILDGSESKDPAIGGGDGIVYFNWDLTDFGVPDVSGTVSTANDITASISAVSAGTYTPELTVSANTGLIDTDTVTIVLDKVPTASADTDETTIQLSGVGTTSATLSGDSDDPSAVYTWDLNGAITVGQVITKELAAGVHVFTLTTEATAGCTGSTAEVTITVLPDPLDIFVFQFDPNFIAGTSAFVGSVLSWEVSGNPISAFIDNGVGWLDVADVSAGTLSVTATDDVIYRMSAYSNTGAIDTALAHLTVNLNEISACKQEQQYIKLYGPDEIRYGECREINLTNFLPDYLDDTDVSRLLGVFEEYLNEMYDGRCGMTLNTSAFPVTACETSACLLSAVDNTYEHLTLSGGGISALALSTPSFEPEESFVDNACDPITGRISILEKIFRLTELFNPDLIPIELIQFYAQNLGYTVGLSRDNVGFDVSAADSVINQKRYLRFMIRNLPTWYKVKTTRNSVKMMLYSFGLIGDFIYYFTKDYLDPTTGIGINTLQTIRGDVSGTAPLDESSYKFVQQLKCDAEEWEKFKNNRKTFYDTLNRVPGVVKDNWILTDPDFSSTTEDISNIPNDYFPTPHFRLWFDILESLATGNFSTDLKKQALIGEAITAIKPINTVFEGITGYMETSTEYYMLSYPRFRKHITLFSTSAADDWNVSP